MGSIVVAMVRSMAPSLVPGQLAGVLMSVATGSSRLVTVKNETAMLTTFNEVDMKPIFDLRNEYKEEFFEKHGVKLGFMSFFTLATTRALKLYPSTNMWTRTESYGLERMKDWWCLRRLDWDKSGKALWYFIKSYGLIESQRLHRYLTALDYTSC